MIYQNHIRNEILFLFDVETTTTRQYSLTFALLLASSTMLLPQSFTDTYVDEFAIATQIFSQHSAQRTWTKRFICVSLTQRFSSMRSKSALLVRMHHAVSHTAISLRFAFRFYACVRVCHIKMSINMHNAHSLISVRATYAFSLNIHQSDHSVVNARRESWD